MVLDFGSSTGNVYRCMTEILDGRYSIEDVGSHRRYDAGASRPAHDISQAS